jgi:hypothetical protein
MMALRFIEKQFHPCADGRSAEQHALVLGIHEYLAERAAVLQKKRPPEKTTALRRLACHQGSRIGLKGNGADMSRPDFFNASRENAGRCR